MVVFAIAILEFASNAIGQGLVFVRIAGIQTGLHMVERAIGHIGLAELAEARLLGHEVHGAARVGRAEQRGVGATQNLDTLIGEGLLTHTAHRAQGQAITVGGGLEAANLEVVVAVVGTVVVGDDAWGVLQQFLCGAGAALLDFLLGHDGNRCRGIEDAGRHLAANPKLLGHHRAGRIFRCRLGVDQDGRETKRLRAWRQLQPIAAIALLNRLQAGSGKQRGQAGRHRVVALQTRAGHALGQAAGADQVHARLTGKARKRAGQRAGGNVVAALGGSHDAVLGHCRRRPARQAHGAAQ
ncbi:hypothetical protein D9M69_430370 [compost metagenome]